MIGRTLPRSVPSPSPAGETATDSERLKSGFFPHCVLHPLTCEFSLRRLSVDLSSVLHMEHKMASAEHRLSEGKFVGPKARWNNPATREKSQTLTQAKEGGDEHAAAAGAQTDENTHRQAEGAAAFQKAASAKAELGGPESGGSKLARMNVVGKGSSQLVMPDLEKTLYPEKVRQNPKRFKIKEEWKGYHLPPQDDVDGLNKKDEGFEIEKPPCGDECMAEKLAFEKKKAELIAQQPWTGSGMLTAAEQEKAIDRMGQGEKLVVGIINGLDEDSEDKGIKHVADIHTISRMGKVRFAHRPAVPLAHFPDSKPVYIGSLS
jgi:hypothetical protein